MTLRPLPKEDHLHSWGPGLHVATGAARLYGIPIENNTCVIELERPGHLLVWNPIALTDRLRESLRDLEKRTGRRVTTLLNPMDFHHLALPEWQQAFPEAETFLVSERIRDHRPGVRGEVLAGDRPILRDAEIELLSARGYRQPIIERSRKWKDSPRREWFVYHRPSRSLLAGDLLIVNDRLQLRERLVGMQVGFTLNVIGFRPTDREERASFAEAVLAWPIDRLLTAHGRASAHGAVYIGEQLRSLLVPRSRR